MFREIVRKKQALALEECKEILKDEPRGVLSLIGDDGYPYGVPINHYYCEENGHIYFHSGKSGHKIDALRACDKASFCVYDGGYRCEGEWALNIKSVIVFGRIQIVENFDEAMDICRKLCYKFTSDSDYIEKEIRVSGKNTLCFKLIPEHITGKKVNES
ncbi:MAG: pyridoxamine 5'-phosphate oxidase family protein [Clostridia bacterium]|nr:pyridoxamine 5'-phosphate oxidase family protein [Clostridia bacterium]